MQFNPLFGGKDKAWGSRNEQAKRGEKQSGFGLKRGIGGLLDFATFGMFDFDKQNRRGAPKGFGIKRIAGGLADAITMGTTDFDKRGSGLLQYSGFTGRKGKRNQLNLSRSGGSSEYYPIDQPRAKNSAEMEEYIKNNPEAKGRPWVRFGDHWVLLTPEQAKERKDKLVKAALGGDKYAQSTLSFDDPSWRKNLTNENVKGNSNNIMPIDVNSVSKKINGVSSNASYEDGAEQRIVIPSISQEQSVDNNQSTGKLVPVAVGGGGGSSEIADALYKGG